MGFRAGSIADVAELDHANETIEDQQYDSAQFTHANRGSGDYEADILEHVDEGFGNKQVMGLDPNDAAVHRHSAHRHELHLHGSVPSSRSPVGVLIFGAVLLHLLGLALWIRAWWREKNKKRDPTMRSISPAPPVKVNCSYDMDSMKKSRSIPRNIEMALKGLDLHGLAGLKPSRP
jgi:hypothetical protein